MSAVSNLAAGAAILAEWLGSGGRPVSNAQAEQRAKACVGCPLNVEPLWWERVTANPIAEVIKSHLAKKSEMGLSVSVETQLSMCRACGCCLPLKVFVPIEHIRSHTNDDVRARLPEHCWMKKENV
jgi:hypothetical protein